MANIVLGCDTNGNDAATIDTVYTGLTSAGHNVHKLEVGPSPFSKYAYTGEAKDKIGVYLMADSLFSFADGYKDLYQLDIFVIRGGVGGGINSQEDFDTKPLGADADCNSVCNEWVGLTYPQMNEKAKGKCIAVYGGTTPEEALQAALQALGGQVSINNAPTATGGASAVNIKDKTFYGLIKQIIGAIDGLFIIANNMAYLLSFKDMYEYRNKYDEFIPIIEPKQILNNSLMKNWSHGGYYNAVEVTYADGTIRCQNDTLIKQYGENVFHYNFPQDDEETARDKADALLAAHIRDYSTDIEISILYNENITAGAWVKLNKSITQLTGKTRKEREQEEIKINAKQQGLNIANINANNINKKNKKKQKTTTIERDYDLFFVQGFNCRWSSKHALIMDVHLKYGPDTPEDPINATISTGGVAAGGANGAINTGGSWGDDCFSICDICFENCRKVLGYAHGRRADAEEYIRTHQADSKYLQGRAKQDSQYAKDVAGKTSAEAYTMFRNKFDYACYSDSCDSSYPCCDDLWTKTNAANCGDSTRMLKVLMDATGTPCFGIHVDGHYFNAVQVNGTWHTLDGTRGPTNSSCNFPDSGNYGYGSNACGSGHC